MSITVEFYNVSFNIEKQLLQKIIKSTISTIASYFYFIPQFLML